MSVSSLEKVLRYAYSNGYTCTQWSDPVEQCLQLSEQDLTQDLCDLLLKHFFSASRVYNTILGSYLAYTLTGKSTPATHNRTTSLVSGKLFLSRLTTKDLRFAFNQDYSNHWSCILQLMSSKLSEVDDDYMSWAPILSKLLVILSQIVVVGLYPGRKSIQQRHQRYDLDDNLDDSDSDDLMKQGTPEDDLTASQQTPEDDLTASQQLTFSFANNTNPLAADSQMTIDPDATFDADATQPEPSIEHQDLKRDINTDALLPGTTTTATTTGNTLYNSQQNPISNQHPSQASSLYPNSLGESTTSALPMGKSSLELDNAICAAKIIIDLIEKKRIKIIIDKFAQENQASALDPEELWVTLYDLLVPENQKSTTSIISPPSAENPTTPTHNNITQKLLLLVERLMDRDLEQQLAVHMKYHELEDEGTARVMPSAGLMGLVYRMVQIRPVLDDDELVSRLVKLQAIKGSFDESFYLEIFFAALTGLREASLSTSCQNRTSKTSADHGILNNCNASVSTNRLLWKNLLLVKVPYLITRLKERKEQEKLSGDSAKRGRRWKSRNEDGVSAVESSLMELKTFTGLLNACSHPACCPNFYVSSSKSTKFMDQVISYESDSDDDDDDEMMDVANDKSSNDLNSPAFIKSIRTISTDDIFTSILRSCQAYGLLPKKKADLLLDMTNTRDNPTNYNNIKSTQYNNNDDNDDPFDSTRPTLKKHSSYGSLFGDIDDAMTLTDTPYQQNDSDGKLDILAQIDQNLEQRINSIRTNITQVSISELLRIGLLSFVHWRKIVDFLLELLSEKAASGDIRGLSRLCGALCDCPPAIDLILQSYPPNDLLSPLEHVCNEWNFSGSYMDVDDVASVNDDEHMNVDDDTNVNDEKHMDGIQNWYFMFGKIWSFVLIVANKTTIAPIINHIFKDRKGLCYRFFVTGLVIYGVDVDDEEVDQMISRWLFAMGGDGISDDLLRTTSIQLLIRATPSIVDRLLCIYNLGKIDSETFTGALSLFQRRYLQFLLVSGVTQKLCDELLAGNASTALTSMSHLFLNPTLPDPLFGLCTNTVLGSLRIWAECQRQYKALGRSSSSSSNSNNNNNNNNTPSPIQQQLQRKEDQDQATAIEKVFITKLDFDDEQHLAFSESSSIGVTRRTLMEKSKEMFRSIVKSGRSMYMNDMGVDTKILWEPVANSKPAKQVISHYLDLVMFQAAMKVMGLHWFVGMIVDQVLEAGKSGGAVRAAELGSSLLTTPLTYNGLGDDTCLLMLRCLLQDVVPSSLSACASENTSFFQGQTLGVFVSDCLVLMYSEVNDKVDHLGLQFFEALVIDRVRGGVDKTPCFQSMPQVGEGGSRCAPWDEKVVSSAVCRGFVKGLMSNPFIKEMWPNAYAS